MGKIVGLTGHARCGKDTMANMLVDKYAFVKLSFASPIRDFVAHCCGLSLKEMEVVKEKPHPNLLGKSPRYAMQTLGTEWGRMIIGNNFWVNLCLEKAKELSDSGLNVVVPDVRFDNEARAIKDSGGMIIKILRPSKEKIELASHESEKGVSKWFIDDIVWNESKPEDMLNGYTEESFKS